MKLLENLEIVGLGLFLRKEKILVISDLHLGYEEAVQNCGVLLPKFQFREVMEQLDKLLSRTKAKKIVVNGDLKHEFGKIISQEWREILKLIDSLLEKKIKIVIVKGTHDLFLEPILQKRGIELVDSYLIGSVMFVHGDEKKIQIPKNVKVLVIGHEHPAFGLREGKRVELFKCFLRGKWKDRVLIVQPSFNPLYEGSDILKHEVLSPYLKKIDDFEVFVVSDGEVRGFGKVRDLRE